MIILCHKQNKEMRLDESLIQNVFVYLCVAEAG